MTDGATNLIKVITMPSEVTIGYAAAEVQRPRDQEREVHGRLLRAFSWFQSLDYVVLQRRRHRASDAGRPWKQWSGRSNDDVGRRVCVECLSCLAKFDKHCELRDSVNQWKVQCAEVLELFVLLEC